MPALSSGRIIVAGSCSGTSSHGAGSPLLGCLGDLVFAIVVVIFQAILDDTPKIHSSIQIISTSLLKIDAGRIYRNVINALSHLANLNELAPELYLVKLVHLPLLILKHPELIPNRLRAHSTVPARRHDRARPDDGATAANSEVAALVILDELILGLFQQSVGQRAVQSLVDVRIPHAFAVVFAETILLLLHFAAAPTTGAESGIYTFLR